MSEDSRQFEQAMTDIPPRWYENLILQLACTLVAYSGIKAGMALHPEHFSNLGLPIISAMLYIYSSILDAHSTLKCLRLMDRADQYGIRHHLVETHILLPDRPSPDTLLGHPSVILDYMGVGLVAIFPQIGIPLAFGKGLIVLNNYRQAQRFERAIDIASGR